MQSAQKSKKQEIPEEFMIQYSNTITYPRTMVIHTSDTGITDGAMMGPRWLYLFALVAVSKSDVRSNMRVKMVINRILDLLPRYLQSFLLHLTFFNVLSIA